MYGSTHHDARLRAMQTEYELLEKQLQQARLAVEAIERKMERNVKRAQRYCAQLNGSAR